MKTSIKMLLVFVGIVLLLVLASDVVLWAYFKKGINGDGVKLRFREEVADKEIVVKPFKAIVIDRSRGNQLEVIADSNYKIAPIGLDGEEMHYKQDGDTLYVLSNNANKVIVYCPSVQLIRAAGNGVNMEISGFRQSSMEVIGLNEFRVNFSDVILNKLTFKGGTENSIDSWQKGSIDSVDIELGLYGHVDFKDLTLNSIKVKGDSLLELNLDKWGLSKLQRVESHFTMRDDRFGNR
jgi:hypothetical protein